MYNNIDIQTLSPNYTDKALELWSKQFTCFCSESVIHACLINDLKNIENYIYKKIEIGQAYGAFKGGILVGFITSNVFNFHGAPSSICHFCGNAADLSDRTSIYLAMYKEVSKLWVEKGVLSHYIGIATKDAEVKNALFQLGFGAYGPYGYAHFDKVLPHKSEYEISVAAANDTAGLQEMINESVDYLANSPLYLKDALSIDEAARAINENRILLAKDKGEIVGFMTTSIADSDNIYAMYTKGCLLTGAPGTYIKEAYRNKGIGSHFISEVSRFCIQNNIPYAHVAWESANIYGNRFWPKYFTPTLLGMKRVISPDIIDRC